MTSPGLDLASAPAAPAGLGEHDAGYRLGWTIRLLQAIRGAFTGRMDAYPPMTGFSAESAENYDATSHRGDEAETVVLLEHLAQGGPALELAIGTGRIALPLAARGIRVDGFDLSPDTVAKLRTEPGGDQLSVTMGDSPMSGCLVGTG